MERPNLRDLPERIRSKIHVLSVGECWEWTAYRDDDGYGMVRYEGKSWMAHRVVYLLVVGQISPGLHIDHLCRNPRCVNPAHLEEVTPAENNRRREEALGIGRYKTHCKWGHEFTPENTYYHKTRPIGRSRFCRKCAAARQRARKARLRDQAAPDQGSML